MRAWLIGLLTLTVAVISLSIADDSHGSPPLNAQSSLTCSGGLSASFDISGDVVYSRSFSRRSLQAFIPSVTVQDYPPGPTRNRRAFIGVPLWNLLNSIGIKVNLTVKNDLLRKYVTITGTDCYQAVFSIGELDPDLGGTPETIVAYGQWAGGKVTPLGQDGFARLIVPGDKQGARRVRNIVHIKVFSVPPPAD
jgi:hypothetical protein